LPVVPSVVDLALSLSLGELQGFRDGGELRAGLDPDLVARMITAPAVSSSLFGVQRSDDETDRQAVELVDLLLSGMAADHDPPPTR
jgi:hypothetical protein